MPALKDIPLAVIGWTRHEGLNQQVVVIGIPNL